MVLNLYIAEITFVRPDGTKPKYYVWGKTKRHAKKRFKTLFPLLKISNIALCDDPDHAIYVLSHPDLFVIV